MANVRDIKSGRLGAVKKTLKPSNGKTKKQTADQTTTKIELTLANSPILSARWIYECLTELRKLNSHFDKLNG